MLGRIAGPFGVRGWVKVISFTDPLEQILDYPLWRADLAGISGQELRHVESRRHGKGLVVRLEGIGDRTAAEALARPELWIERREMPALKDGEYYRADLVGFEVVNVGGQRLGRVEHFLDLPANAVMVVVGEREHWLPLGPQQLFRVDLGRGRITVDWDPEF
ncbi:MAG: ribosome maturation factor RimM [Steroidobacteraceae bacterium]